MKKTKRLVIVVFVAMMMLVLTGCVVKMPVPEVKEGRFDFSVTYELNGEVKTYSGVYVCKYKGVYVTFVGRGRMWEGFIENCDTGTVIIVETVDDQEVCIDIGFYPDYFMSDPDCYNEEPRPYIYVQSYNEETDGVTYCGDEEEIYENYGVKIISYYYAEPIENSYNEKLTYGFFEPSIN